MPVQKSLLRMLVVQRLMQGPASGYTLVKDIDERTGWKPSFGSIYPLLEKMQQDKLVTVKEEGRRKAYSLTPEGKDMFEQQREQRVQAFSHVAEHLRVLECLSEEEQADTSWILETLKRGDIPFQEIPEARDVRQQMFRLLREGKVNTKRKEIRAVFGSTLRELKKL